jgi:hypothetical protein
MFSFVVGGDAGVCQKTEFTAIGFFRHFFSRHQSPAQSKATVLHRPRDLYFRNPRCSRRAISWKMIVMRSSVPDPGPTFCDTERRETPLITLPAPAAPHDPEPISELRQEIADMHVQQPPTWRRHAAALGNQARELAIRHPGAAVLGFFGLGLAVGTASVLLSRHRDSD